MSDIVQKLWGFCHTLRHDGVDYGELASQARHESVALNYNLRFAHRGHRAVVT
jgi:hypothetical protein